MSSAPACVFDCFCALIADHSPGHPRGIGQSHSRATTRRGVCRTPSRPTPCSQKQWPKWSQVRVASSGSASGTHFVPVPLLLRGPPKISWLILKRRLKCRLPAIILERGFAPVRRVPLLCVPKERNRKKGHPRLCAPKTGVPSLEACLSGSGQGTFSLSLSLLRSKDRGSPSVANPLGGTTVHWTVVFFRLAPGPGPDARGPSRAPSGLGFGCAPRSA